MNINTPDGTIYAGDITLSEAQDILAAYEAEVAHEGCAQCRGTLTLAACRRAEERRGA
jgi:hypothetical protein